MSISYRRRHLLRHPIELTILTCVIVTLVACTKSRADASPATGAADSSSASNSSDDSGDSKDPPIDCNKIFTPADAAGILTKPATVGSYAPFPRSCIFEVPGAEFRVHTGTDFTSEMGWNEMSNSANSSKYKPLPNVGDRAFYRIDNSFELMSKKGKMYCSAIGSAFSTGDFTPDRGAALATKVGALCTKMFAAG
ncbi:MAG: hypothetical protein ABI664_17165 [bacterium]